MSDMQKITPASYLRDEYETHQALFQAQPVIVQRFIETQAQHLADALVNNLRLVRFSFPDRVVNKTPYSGEMAAMLIPGKERDHIVGGLRMRLEGQTLQELLKRKLGELEQSPDQAINTGAVLLRYSIAIHLIYRMLPAGRAVTYRADDDEQIPTIPMVNEGEVESAITSATDAIVEQGAAENGRGELLVPFVPAARRFYLPQWVAFDEDGKMLVNSVSVAESYLASMQRYIDILHIASSVAPYIVADDDYQRKRYGMLGQVINQGRALARYRTAQIIKTIYERVEKGTLNRGLSIDLPYYDDQELRTFEMCIEIIPGGRIVFKPIFVVRATRLEYAKVSQDTRLNPSTRKHLLQELDMLEQAFVHFPMERVK